MAKEPFPDDLFKYCENCNPALVWQMYKGLLENELFKGVPSAVPFLSESQSFNAGCLVVQIREKSDSKKEAYCSLGPLKLWVDNCGSGFEGKSSDAIFDQSDYSVKPWFDKMSTKPEVDKQLFFALDGYLKMVYWNLGKDEIQINMSKLPKNAQSSKSIFIIDQVWITPRMQIKMRIGDEIVHYEANYVPLAFTMTKYELDPKTGLLGQPSASKNFFQKISSRFFSEAQVEWVPKTECLDRATLDLFQNAIPKKPAVSAEWNAYVQNYAAKRQLPHFLKDVALEVEKKYETEDMVQNFPEAINA